MVTYKKEELVGITELGKALGSYLDKITSHSFEKLAVIRRNKPEAVIVPIEEYERLKHSADLLEELEIAQIVQERVVNKTKPLKSYSIEEMKAQLRDRGKDVV